MGKLFFVRHGKTLHNAKVKGEIKYDTVLTDAGEQMARHCGQTWKERVDTGQQIAPAIPTMIVTSPMTRTMQTAEKVMQGLGLTPGIDVKVVLAPWLRERIDSDEDRGTPWTEWVAPGVASQFPGYRQREGPQDRVEFVARPESYVWNDGSKHGNVVRDTWSNNARKEDKTQCVSSMIGFPTLPVGGLCFHLELSLWTDLDAEKRKMYEFIQKCVITDDETVLFVTHSCRMQATFQFVDGTDVFSLNDANKYKHATIFEADLPTLKELERWNGRMTARAVVESKVDGFRLPPTEGCLCGMK